MSKQAVEAPRTNHFNMLPEELVIVDQPGATFYDERVNLPLRPEFVANIAHYGVQEPVLAVKRDDDIVVIAGRQRVRAAREINKGRKPKDRMRVPVIMKRAEEAVLEGIAISENEHRVQDDPITRAHKMQRRLDQLGDAEAVARDFGVSVQVVKQAAKLLDMPSQVQESVRERKVPASAALKLTKLPAAKQVEAVKTIAESGGSKAHAAKRAAKAETPEPVPSIEPPSKALLRKLAAVCTDGGFIGREASALLDWIAGDIDEDAAVEEVAGLDKALEAARLDGRKRVVGVSDARTGDEATA